MVVLIRPVVGPLLLLASAAAGPGESPGAQAVGPPSLATLQGRVAFGRTLAPLRQRPSIGDLGMPTESRDTPDSRLAVVYLEVGPRGAFEEHEAGHAIMDQRRETFVPSVLAVQAGTVVDFRNADRTYHNVFSLSKAKSFDLGRYPSGQSKAVRFDRPGVVRVFCEIHSHMSAFILVFAHRFFAVTGRDGAYRISGIPPGGYTVSVWHPVLAAEPRTVVIPEGGTGEISLDFELW